MKKSPGVAFLLGFLFGPFGLLYVGVMQTVAAFLVLIVVTVVTGGIGALPFWILCGIWGAVTASQHNGKLAVAAPPPQPQFQPQFQPPPSQPQFQPSASQPQFQPPAAQSVPLSAVQTGTSLTTGKFCTGCGARAALTARFCGKCGATIA